MRSRLVIFLILGVSLVFGLLFARQAWLSKGLPREKFAIKKLRVLTYSTFAGANGPGAEIFNQFKAECGCDVTVVTAGDAGLLLERLKVGEAGTPFDLVIGLDQLMIETAQEQFQWKEMYFGSQDRHEIVAELSNPHFVAFDWAPLAFVYRKGDFSVPEKIDDLLKPEYKKAFALQDPRSSTPGLQFFHWIQAVKGARAPEFLVALKPNVNSISPSWSFSYGLFKKEQTRFVFSYLTSLAYHWGVENDRSFQVAKIAEGHPVQVEYVGVPATCRECELAEKLVEKMLSPSAQKIIMEKNFMFPVIKGLEEGTIFAELPKLKPIRTKTGKDFSDWDRAFKN